MLYSSRFCNIHLDICYYVIFTRELSWNSVSQVSKESHTSIKGYITLTIELDDLFSNLKTE